MESMVEENGSAVDPLSPDSHSGDSAPAIATSVQSLSRSQLQTHHLVASTSIVQLTLPTSVTTQVQSVIQPNHQSVIQSATNIQPVAISKGNVILVSKPNSVIQSAQGSLQALQVVETASDDSCSDDESPKKRRDLLTRRASYRKILNDLSASEIAAGPLPPLESSLECDSNVDSDMSSHSLQYQTDYTGHGVVVEDAARKREMRLQKNREAARECRRKKKEYIKCLENRVAVLENRNQTLIDELKTLKELYQHQQKAE
ncbi:cyclic-AMP response element binding protein B isoform X7 [Cotesia typhae]|uniref:cyclic-AMP response element binding protein B isoform X7 n=1 Tax=Cotesia typhae TaxID=2053667 RepID=UPI003D68522F